MKPRLQDIHFSHILGVLKPTRPPEEALLKHKSLARRTRLWSNRTQSTLQLLQSVGNWISSPNSSLLVLQTQPRAQARVKQVTTELISHLQPQSKQIVWYLSATCSHDESTASAIDVIRTLLYQFLKLMPDLVIACPNNFSTVKMESQHSDDEWLGLLCCVVDHLGSGFIIVEAEDVLTDPEEGSRLTGLLRQLVSHCKVSRLSVKILVVSYDKSWEELNDIINAGGQIIQVQRQALPKKMRRRGKPIFPTSQWTKSVRR